MNTKNRTHKGFTTVELVIVIAVIAILATVLIPTFSNMIEKANLSVDTQNVRNMNVCLATYITAGDPEDFGMVKDRLKEFGYGTDDNFVAKTKGHSIRWYAEKNVILLVNDAEKKVVYPEEYKDLDITKDGAMDIRMFFDLSLPAAKVTKNENPSPITNAHPLATSPENLAVMYIFETATDASNENYDEWGADFYISFKNSDGTLLAATDYNKLYDVVFAGFYPGWAAFGIGDDTSTDEEEWLVLPVKSDSGDDLTTYINSDGEFPLVGTLINGWLPYDVIRDMTEGVFKCGVIDEVGGDDAGIVLSVELRLTNYDTEEVVVVGMYNYTFQ